MEFIDYYKILGVDKNATEDDIKKAYRKLARKLPLFRRECSIGLNTSRLELSQWPD